MRMLVALFVALLRSLLALIRSREEQTIVELALRQQLAVYAHQRRRPIFSPAVTHAIKSFEIDPKRTAFRSPWQNGTAERVVGSVRRELPNHVIVLNEDNLRRLLREYVDYYN